MMAFSSGSSKPYEKMPRGPKQGSHAMGLWLFGSRDMLITTHVCSYHTENTSIHLMFALGKNIHTRFKDNIEAVDLLT